MSGENNFSNMYNKNLKTILSEISAVLGDVNSKEVNDFITEIFKARKIVLTGAGRVGMAVRGFAMRLAHLGLKSHMVGDATVPSVGKGDLLIVASGSGETQTIFDLVVIAKKNKARVALVTANKISRMGNLSDFIVIVPAPSKTKKINNLISIQPMTTLNEQCLGIFFDTIVLELMSKMNETHDSMWKRHSNLE